MSKSVRRGRKPEFEPDNRKLLAELIRRHGARRARAFAPVSISVGTGIKLKKGRRPRSVA